MQNSGTLISSAIRPNDSSDQIASAFANEIKGGAHGYETYVEMFDIIEARREWGMLVNVYNDANPDLNGTYQLKYGNTGDNVFDISDNSNWVKINLGESTSTEWVDSVISILTIEPTLEPFPGHRYLLGTTSDLQPQGTNWGNYSESTIIVEYSNIGTWKITIPTNGMTVRVDNEDNSIYKYEGNYPNGIWKQEKITQVFYIEPSGNGLTYSVSTDPIFNTYSRDLIFLTKFNTANNGTTSININGLGYKDIKIVTKNGVRDLIITDIITNVIYSLTYNGTYFQMTKPFPSDAYNIKYYIPEGEVVTVQENEQYWVYGDLTIDGTLVNYGKVIIANGTVINSGNLQITDDGQVITIDLFDSPIFNTSDTIQLSSVMTINGPSVSAIVLNNSLTPSHINSVNTATASWILSNDGNGSFQWVLPTSGGLDINSDLFYNLETVVPATDSTSAIYRTGSINIGTGTTTDGRFVVSSSTGSVSLVVSENGAVSIGGTLSSYPLTVYGNAQVTNFFYTNVTQVSNAIIFDGGGNTGIKRNNLGLEFFNFATSSSAIRFTNNSYNTNTGETTMLVDVDKKYVGIGTASPSTTLHIYATQSGAFRLEDGTQGPGYVLTSDVNGVASWTASVKPVVETNTNYTLQNSDNGGIVIFTATASLTVSTGLEDGFECTFVTLTGVTLTVSPAVGVTLFNNTGLVLPPELSFTLKRRVAADQFITSGNL